MATYHILANWRYTETVRDGVHNEDELTLIGIQTQDENWNMIVDSDWEEAKDTSALEPCVLKTHYVWTDYEFECDKEPEPSEFKVAAGLRIIHVPAGTTLEFQDVQEDIAEYKVVNGYKPTENDPVEELVEA